METQVLNGVKLPIGASEAELLKIAEKKLRRKPAHFKILKKSLDARNKNDLKYVYSIEFSDRKPPEKREEIERLPKGKQPNKPVLIVGSGPAGLFCALRLIQRGISPVVIERGDCVEEREKKIKTFSEFALLDTESNVQFGEGGAGTFSDGKLNTRTHEKENDEVYRTFVRFGAPEEILYLNKPHIGSDNLKKVVKNIRRYIVDNGGRVEFNTKLTDVCLKEGKLLYATLKKGNEERKIEPSALVLCIGHSARDTFEMLHARGVCMTQKDFAIGARIEHLQSEIGKAQYGNAYSFLPAADYRLVSHVGDRAAFSFCMCPGGFVMPAASEEGGVVTNGMSNYDRAAKNANSALVVQVRKEDFGGDSPLAGVEFQRKIERAAYAVGGKNYRAPVQLVKDFLAKKESSSFGAVLPSYAVGTTFADLNGVLPPFVTDTMRAAIVDMDRRLKGFASPDAVLTAAESRTSSPVRIERGENLQSIGVQGLYPCGEGAGYAGGITSSAADGIRVADAVFASLL